MQSNGDIFRRWKESVLGDGSMTDGGGGTAKSPRTDCPTTDKHGVRGNLRIAFSTTTYSVNESIYEGFACAYIRAGLAHFAKCYKVQKLLLESEARFAKRYQVQKLLLGSG